MEKREHLITSGYNDLAEQEQAVLGAILIDNQAIDNAVEILTVESFYKPAHQRMFEAMLRLYDRNEPIDYATVTAELEIMHVLEDVGGAYYVTELANTCPSAANIEWYANIVRKASIRREVVAACLRSAQSDVVDGDEFLEQAQVEIMAIGLRRKEKCKTMFELTAEVSRIIENPIKGLTGLSTGIKALDKQTQGFQRGDLIIVAGRPSMGKSSYMFNVVYKNAVDEGLPVGVFSLEMSEFLATIKLLAIGSGVDSRKIQSGVLDEDEKIRVAVTNEVLSEAHIHMIYCPGLTDFELRSKARRMKREHGIELFAVDYIQRMSSSVKADNANQGLTKISDACKSVAAELNVPGLVLSQLNRSVEHRNVKKPILSDLRESGAIEQDADVVIFTYRDVYYKEDAPENEAEFIIAKQRMGPTGTVWASFQKESGRFADLDTIHTPNGVAEEIEEKHF